VSSIAARFLGRRVVGARTTASAVSGNSSDYRLHLPVRRARPRTEAGTDSRNALAAIVELSDPAKAPVAPADENSEEATADGPRCRPESLVTMPDEAF
jgi:hypothetical protein